MKKKQFFILLIAGISVLAGCSNRQSGTQQSSSVSAPNQNSETIESETAASETTESEAARSTIFQIAMQSENQEYQDDAGKNTVLRDECTYAVVSGGAKEAADLINRDLNEWRRTREQNVQNLTSEAREMYQDADITDVIYTTGDTMYTTRNDGNVLSFRTLTSQYTGGAHGYFFYAGCNYNAKTGDKLSMDEIAGDGDTFRAKVKDYVLTLCQSEAFQYVLFDDYKDQLDDSLFGRDNWYFDSCGMVISVEPYAIGPYSSTTINFTIPYDDLMSYGLKQEYAYQGIWEQSIYNGTSVRTDLNGDGNEDEIHITKTDNEEGSLRVTVNGNDISNDIFAALSDPNTWLERDAIVLTDLDSGDQRKEITIAEHVYDENAAGSTKEWDITHCFEVHEDNSVTYLGKIQGNVRYYIEDTKIQH